MFQPSTLLSMRRPTREFCSDMRLSDRCPEVVLLNGMVLKLVPIPLPTSVERITLVKSTKPSGVNLATPISNESGLALASGSCSYEFDLGSAGAVDGRFPVVLATSPPTRLNPGAFGAADPLDAGWAEGWAPGCAEACCGAGLAASVSSICFCSSIACFS